MELNQKIDLNADLGEGFAHDLHILQLVSSVNIACGGHAGDDVTMCETIRLAMQANVSMGAHPGFEDRERFGRHRLDWTAHQVYESMLKQIQTLYRHAFEAGGTLKHVKPHGALYHLLLHDEACAQAFVDAIYSIDENLLVFTMPFGSLRAVAERKGLKVICEGFADRRYEADGMLTPRSLGNEAMIHDSLEAEQQVLGFIKEQMVQTREGQRIVMPVQTICVHGDGDFAVEQLMRIRALFEREKIQVSARFS